MTLSDAARTHAIRTALQRMLEELGTNPIDAVRFEVESPRFDDLPQTTWLELEERHWVEPMHAIGSAGYRLTGEGWIAALKASGGYDTPTQRERCVALRVALKDVVKGRPLTGALTDLGELQAATQLDPDWIFNALASRLLQHLWPREHLDIKFAHGFRAIRVPARFGSIRLSGREAGPFPDR